jgi:hypothetical protein
LHVNQNQIVNMSITPGSIQVAFVVVPGSNTSAVELQQASSKLLQQVNTGNFTFTFGSTTLAAVPV